MQRPARGLPFFRTFRITAGRDAGQELGQGLFPASRDGRPVTLASRLLRSTLRSCPPNNSP